MFVCVCLRCWEFLLFIRELISFAVPPYSLFLVCEYRVSAISCADRVTINYIAKEDTTVTNLACVCYCHYYLNSRLNELLSADDCDLHALNHISRVLYTSVNALLTTLANSVYIVVLKPVNV